MLFVSKKMFLSLLCLSLCVALSGCVPVVVGGIAAGGYTAMRDKNVGTSVNDTKIDAVIKTKLYKINPELYSDVSVSVDNGNVLLTGVVRHEEWIHMAEKEAWSVKGVVSVDNNISSGERLSVGRIISDGAITSNVRSSFICDTDIKSVNYKIKTMNAVVYIRGIARSEKELQAVLSRAQHAKGVKKVVSYVTVSNG